MGIEDSIARHPASQLHKQADKSPHDLGWALGMAKKLGEVEGERRAEARIIKLLEQAFVSDGELLASAKLNELITLIKGEQNNSCEPKDLPCVNGFSCKKHAMSLEDAARFIKGDQE